MSTAIAASRTVAGDRQRLDWVQTAMQQAGLELLAVHWPENVVLLSGCYPLLGMSWLLLPVAGDPVLLAPGEEVSHVAATSWVRQVETFAAGDAVSLERCLAAVVQRQGWSGLRVGLDSGCQGVAPPARCGEIIVAGTAVQEMLERVFAGGRTADAAQLLYRCRMVKTDMELERLRRAARVALFGVEAFQQQVRPGVTQAQLVAAVEGAIMVRGTGYDGARVVRGFAQVTSGRQGTAAAARLYLCHDQTPLAAGELALLELGVVVDGWWCDLTRVRCAGEPEEHVREAWQVLECAQTAARMAVRPGVLARDVDAVGRAVLEQADLAQFFPHITGHGIGCSYHEPMPIIGADSDDVLVSGMVFSIEPGIYAPHLGGMRLEDIVAVTADGQECLSDGLREL